MEKMMISTSMWAILALKKQPPRYFPQGHTLSSVMVESLRCFTYEPEGNGSVTRFPDDPEGRRKAALVIDAKGHFVWPEHLVITAPAETEGGADAVTRGAGRTDAVHGRQAASTGV